MISRLISCRSHLCRVAQRCLKIVKLLKGFNVAKDEELQRHKNYQTVQHNFTIFFSATKYWQKNKPVAKSQTFPTKSKQANLALPLPAPIVPKHR